jgi:hypothetical protein
MALKIGMRWNLDNRVAVPRSKGSLFFRHFFDLSPFSEGTGLPAHSVAAPESLG